MRGQKIVGLKQLLSLSNKQTSKALRNVHFNKEDVVRVISVLIASLFVVAAIGCGQAKKQAPVAAKDSITVKLATPVADTAKTVDTTAVLKK